MPVLFANPLGLFALLGIPVVLAVHFLHRQSKAIPVSTLFLIEHAREPAQSGRRWHRFLPSIPMWLQLLMVLLITALLARPYRPEGVLQIAVVIDESASMTAYRDSLAARLSSMNDELRQAGQKNQWHIFSANSHSPVIYSGDEPEPWFESIRRWQPSESWRNPDDSLRLARSKVGVNGVVIYATDTPEENLPSGVSQLSVGTPIDNVGIAGVTTSTDEEKFRWQAVIVNHSDRAASRQWQLQWNGTNAAPPQVVTLEPRGMITLEGVIPEDAKRMVLTLESDRFPLDDYCPFVRETPKPLAYASLGVEAPPWLVERLGRMVPRLQFSTPAVSDFALVGLEAGAVPPPVAGIHFSSAGKRDAPFISKMATPINHPLIQGLSWAGLAVQKVDAPAPQENDLVLLWADTEPLISLRQAKIQPPENDQADEDPAPPATTPAGPQLILHFNPNLSNFDRLPAGAILMLRYAELIRAKKEATTWAQVDPRQDIRALLGSNQDDQAVIEQLDIQGSILSSEILPRAARAPSLPGFIRVKNQQTVLLEASVSFRDSRESDLTYCQPLDTTGESIQKAKRASIPTDNAILPLICLCALASLLLLYKSQSKSTGEPDTNTARKLSRSPAA